MTSAWKAVKVGRLPVLVKRQIPLEESFWTSEQSVLDHDMLVAGQRADDLICSEGWYGGQLGTVAILTDLKSVAWAMPIGFRVRLRFGEPQNSLWVLEGAWSFSVFQMLCHDGYYTIDSKYEDEHDGNLIDESDRPPKGSLNRAQLEMEWIRRHAKDLGYVWDDDHGCIRSPDA